MASSVCCVVYASHEKLRVQSSLASWMLRGPVAWRLRTVLVPASRSQVLTRLVAPPRVAISARIPSMADCRVTCLAWQGPGVLEGEDLRVVPVEAGVLEGLSGLVGLLSQVGQKRRRNPLVHVGEGGGGREEGGGEREEGGGREEGSRGREGGGREQGGGGVGGKEEGGRRKEEEGGGRRRRREDGGRREGRGGGREEEGGGGGGGREEEGGGGRRREEGEKGGEGRGGRGRGRRERERERERVRERV